MMKRKDSRAKRLTVKEDMTIYRAHAQKKKLLDAVVGAECLELNLASVGEMDTAGFQLLVLAKRESERLGHELNIVAHSPAVREVIDFYNMTAFFGDPMLIPAERGKGH
jgi:anti-anti-sigma factor